MASDCDENNLADLRSAVLASLKTTSNASINDTKSDDEEEDLEALRQAALMSRKSLVKNNEEKCSSATSHIPQGRTQFLPRWRYYRSGLRGSGQHKFHSTSRSNLIVINTVPLESDVSVKIESKSVSKLLLPQDRSVYTESLSKLDSKNKSSGRFSRFDTSSESEESDLDSVSSSSDARDGAAFSSEGHQRLGASEDSTTQDMDGHEGTASDEFSSSHNTSSHKIDCDNTISKGELRISGEQLELEEQKYVKGSKATFHQGDKNKLEFATNIKNYSDGPETNKVQNMTRNPKQETEHLSDRYIEKDVDVVEGYNHDYIEEQFSKPDADASVEKTEATQKESKIVMLTPNQILPCETKDKESEFYTDSKDHDITASDDNFSGKCHFNFCGKRKNSDPQYSEKRNGIHGFQHTTVGASNISLRYGRTDNKPLSTWDLRMELKRRKEERGKRGINHNVSLVSTDKKKSESVNHSRSTSATSRSSSSSSSQSESSEKGWSDSTSDSSSISPNRSPSHSRSSSPLVKSVLSVVKPVCQKSDMVRMRHSKPTQEHVDKSTVWTSGRSDRMRNSEHISHSSRLDAENKGRNGISRDRKKMSPLSLSEERAANKHYLEREVYLGNSMLLSGTSFEKSKKLPVHMRLGLPQKHHYETSQKEKLSASPKSERKDTRHKERASFTQTVREVSFSSSRGSSDIYVVSSKPQKTDNDLSSVKPDHQKRPYKERSHDRRKKKKKKR